MTILQALNGYYDRMAARGEAEATGYSREKISFAIVLSLDGEVFDKIDLRVLSGRKPQPVLMDVPTAVKRTAGVSPNFLWDKSAYVLGRTAAGGKRTAEEHAAFKTAHLASLAGTNDEGLVALRRFLERWTPDQFDASPFVAEMLDANLIFCLSGEQGFIHERAAATRLVAARGGASGERATSLCLVTGADAPVRRLHPVIKGVEGAQSSGAALVSFNLDAFTSHGKEQGDNAPTSELAAERYGAALNRMLDRGSRNRVPRPIGGTSVVFWADASGLPQAESIAADADDMFAGWLTPDAAEKLDDANLDRDESEAAKLRDTLEAVAGGRPAASLEVGIADKVRFHVLGLAPNAARLSVRFWMEDSFAHFAERLKRHYDDLDIHPRPWRAKPPSVQRLLVKTTALQEKFDNIPPLLAGEMMRAVLTGGSYPRTLLTAAITRLRAGDDPATGWHAAAIRAVLVRDLWIRQPDDERRRKLDLSKEGLPVSLEKANANPAYLLGRLFAALETAQRLSLGKVNATIRDRYFGAASATPAGVFPLLLRGVQNHLGKLRKEGKGGWVEREIEEIIGLLPPALPRSLRLEAQGRFAIGYYHQRKAQFAGKPVDLDDDGDDNAND